ncbi:MAG: CBS domain-containing protein [Sphingobacteriales bacterium]|nr:CBS domain-containing protein [Sphingobacteriales bacterium]
MRHLTTFFFSRLLGCDIFDARENILGSISDVWVQAAPHNEEEAARPKIAGIIIKTGGEKRHVQFTELQIVKFGTKYKVQCQSLHDVQPELFSDGMLLKANILDKQIVDITGRKLVRVNDIRMVAISNGAYAIAVDVGMEGLLRRIGIEKSVKFIVKLFRGRVSSKYILWDDIEAVDFSNLNIKLSKTQSRLHTLHPSDVADIIEELGKSSKTTVFSSLDLEKAADVLEELEDHEQVHIIENLSVEKAADVLEKMPANEAADIIDRLEDRRAEALLEEMEKETSDEVRELLEYPNTEIGSIMSTDVLSFNQHSAVKDVLMQIRQQKPDMELLYNFFIVDSKERLVATVSLRDLLISEPDTLLKQIMKKKPISVYDEDPLDSLAEIVSKYNLLAVPVIYEDEVLAGMVVVDDILEDLIGKRRTK